MMKWRFWEEDFGGEIFIREGASEKKVLMDLFFLSRNLEQINNAKNSLVRSKLKGHQ